MMFTRVQNARISVVAAAVALLAVMLAVFFGGTALAHHGDSRDTAGDAYVLLLADSKTAADPNQTALLESVVTAFASGNNIENKGLLFYGASAGDVVSGSNFELRAALQSWLASVPELERRAVRGQGSDLSEALFVAHDYLDDRNAVSGSRVLVVSSGAVERNSESELIDRAQRWLSRGWIIDGILTGDPHDSDIGYLAAETHGLNLSLAVPDDFGLLLEHMISLEVPTQEITYSSVLKRGNELIVPIEVPPMTSSLELLVYREHREPFTNVRVIQPNGQPVEPSGVSESPHVLVYRSSTLGTPMSGSWSVQASGTVAGSLAVQSRLQSPITATLLNAGLPLDREFVLEAVTEFNNHAIPLRDVELLATMRYGDAPVTTYLLMDDGMRGDALADDGIYSAVVPALKGGSGTADVDLTVRWPSEDVELTNSTSVSVLEFPEVVVRDFTNVRVGTSGDWLLANVDVVLNGEPYLVDVNRVNVGFEGLVNSFPATRIVPENGNTTVASRFTVWGRPLQTDTYKLVSNVAVDYQGYQNFTATFESEPRKLTAGGVPSLHSRPGWLGGAPFWLPLMLPLVLIAIGLAVYKIVRLPRPFGYLVDDNGKVLVNFRDFRGGVLRTVFARNKIRAQDVPGLGMSNLTFVFERSEIKVRYEEDGDAVVRINSIPCPPSAAVVLKHNDYLGFGGTLLKVCYHLPKTAPQIGRELTLQES